MANIALNGAKCQFRLHKLTFFGHDLSREGVSPSEEKIVTVVNAQPPKNASEVCSFVQLFQYSSKFIPNSSQVAEPLRKLLRKHLGCRTTKGIQRAQKSHDISKNTGLFQRRLQDKDNGRRQFQEGEWRAVSYVSRNLTEIGRRYYQTEKEALALV